MTKTRCFCSAAVLFGIAACLGCDTKRQALKALSAAQKEIQRGDSLLQSTNWQEAKEAYGVARSKIAEAAQKGKSQRGPLREQIERLQTQADLRCDCFGRPIPAVRAAIRLAGSGDADDLALAFWDADGLAELALGEDRWTALSEEAKDRLKEVAETLTTSRLEKYRAFYAKVEQNYVEQDTNEMEATLMGTWRFGQTRFPVKVYVRRDGPLWRIVDVYSGVMGVRMSEILFHTIESLERIRPLEEILAQPDALAVIEEALMIVQKEAMESEQLSKNVTFIVKESVLERDSGGSRQIERGTVVELLEETRKTDNGVWVLVRPVMAARMVGKERSIPDTSPGWVPEEALPDTGDETLWGL